MKPCQDPTGLENCLTWGCYEAWQRRTPCGTAQEMEDARAESAAASEARVRQARSASHAQAC